MRQIQNTMFTIVGYREKSDQLITQTGAPN